MKNVTMQKILKVLDDICAKLGARVNIQNHVTAQYRDEEAIQFAETLSRETEARIIDQQRRGKY